MRIRHLAVGVLGIVTVYVLVQAILSGPGGPPQVLDDGTINVTAVEDGRGAWVPYTLTVRNLGTQDFTGRVLMLKQTAPPPTAGARVNVRGLGVLISPVAPGGETSPPDAAYQFPVALSGRHKQSFSFFAPDDFSSVLVQDTRQRQVAEGQVDDRKSIAVGVLTDSATLPAALEAVRIGDYTLRLTDWTSGASLPTQPALLSGYSAIVLDKFDSSKLTHGQLVSLVAFVGLGGELLVAGGADLGRTVAALPEQLQAFTPSGGAAAGSLNPVADLSGLQTVITAALARGAPVKGASTLLDEEDGRPLMVESRYGEGRVVALLFDPDAGTSAPGGLAAVDQLALTQALGRGLEAIPGAEPAGRTLLDAGALPEILFPRPSDQPLPPTWLVGGILLFYLIVVSPLNYLLVRRLQLPALFWLTSPLLAITFTGFSYAVGAVLQSGVTDREIQFYRVGPDGIASRTDVHGLVFPSRGDHQVTFGLDNLVAPYTITFPDLTPSCNGCLFPGGSGAGKEEHVLPGAPLSVSETAVDYGGVRIVGSGSAGQVGLSLLAHLASVDDRLEGSVVNTGTVAISGLIAYTYYQGGYRSAVLAEGLAPGSSVKVDAMPEPIGGGAPQLPPGTQLTAGQQVSLVADETGRRTLSHSGEVALVGFVRPVNSGLRVDGVEPGGEVVAAFGMPVELEAAQGRLGEVAVPRLAGFYPDTASGSFRDTYDVTLPPATGPLILRYDKRLYTDVQVYDWTARAWLAGPFTDDPASGIVRLTQLTPDEVHGGIVRVRVTEISLTWGSEITVRFPDESP